ncbi:MAG: pseudaminic acid synthase [Bacteroidia bacterium]
MNDIRLGKYTIGKNHPPFIIAEMSGNHNQSLERALKIVEEAAACGAHAIKIQTYTPDTLTIDYDKGLFFIKDKNSLWKGRTLYDLYKEAMTPWEWHKPIFDYSQEKGIIAFSSPFDITAVDFLEKLNCPFYKIASFENCDYTLLKSVASTGKPVIMSTGLSTFEDISDSVKVLRNNGCKDLILLKCTSSYPASPEDSNLVTIPEMENKFQCHVGLSDHTFGIGAAVASVALGARVIEKHFTLSRADGGVDSAFSLEPHELKNLIIESERAFFALGKISFEISESEKRSLRYKRSIYLVKDIKAGEVFTNENIRVIRPGDGLHPKHIESVIGKKAKSDLKRGEPLSWDDVSGRSEKSL